MLISSYYKWWLVYKGIINNIFVYISVYGRMEDYNFVYEFLKTKNKDHELEFIILIFFQRSNYFNNRYDI